MSPKGDQEININLRFMEIVLIMPLISLLQQHIQMGDEMNINNLIAPKQQGYFADMNVTVNLDHVFVRLMNDLTKFKSNIFLYLQNIQLKYKVRNFRNENPSDREEVIANYKEFQVPEKPFVLSQASDVVNKQEAPY